MTIEQLIQTHGARAVYLAADDTMSSRNPRALEDLGFRPRNLGDTWRAMSAAMDALPRQDLDAIERSNRVALAYAGARQSSPLAASSALRNPPRPF